MHDSLRNLQCSANCSATKLRLVKQANSLPPTTLLLPPFTTTAAATVALLVQHFQYSFLLDTTLTLAQAKRSRSAEEGEEEPKEEKSCCCSLLSFPGRHVVDVVVLLLHVQVPPCGGLCLPESLNLSPRPYPVCHALPSPAICIC